MDKLNEIYGKIINESVDRFFGMMPSKEVVIEKTYDTGHGLKVTVQSGVNGWSVLYADGSSDYKDVEDTPKNNFDKAFSHMSKYFENVKYVGGFDKSDK